MRCTAQSQLGPLEQCECAETVKPVCISGPEQRGEREANKAVERLQLSQIAPLCPQYGYEPDLSCTLTSTCPSKIHVSSPLMCVRGKMARSEAVTFTYHLSLFPLPLKSTNSNKFSGGGEYNIVEAAQKFGHLSQTVQLFWIRAAIKTRRVLSFLYERSVYDERWDLLSRQRDLKALPRPVLFLI